MIIRGDAGEIGALSGDERDRAGVDVVGLAPCPVLEGPTRAERVAGTSTDAATDELLGQQLAQAAGA